MKAETKNGVRSMIGKQALVIEDIRPEGNVLIWGDIWKANGYKTGIPTGTQVRIVDVKGLVFIVEAAS